MGVMVPCEKILQCAIDNKADIVGLSGLITPSLDEMCHVAHEMTRRGMQVPLLIGGATTSKTHTAVKIAPKYKNAPTVHVLDASRSVPVCSTLILGKTDNRYHDFVDELALDYADIRDEYLASIRDRKLISLQEARRHRLQLDFSHLHSIPQPAFIGHRDITNILERQGGFRRLIEFIDWKPFFDVWQLRGKYPNRGYPKLFNDPDVGPEAKKLHQEALDMLKKICDEKWLELKGYVGFYKAKSRGDDIDVMDGNDKKMGTFFGLRQQEAKDMSGGDPEPYLCLSDFISHQDGDYLGMFAVTAGLGCADRCRDLEQQQHDDYSAIMLKALADRLAEAFAEFLHFIVRTDRSVWGYDADNEKDLDTSRLLRLNYRGIRPAPGYPTQPDHTEKQLLWQLLGQPNEITLVDDSLAMDPAASVCGLYFAHPKSSYFAAGKLGRDQLVDYANRKQMKLELSEQWLRPYLAYDEGEN